MPTILTRQDRPIRPLPAGCDQQQRYETRTHRVHPVRLHGSADALGDDQSERHSVWGSLPECEAKRAVNAHSTSARGWLWFKHRPALITATAAAAAVVAATAVVAWGGA